MQLIDTHCHLTEHSEADVSDILQRAVQAEVTHAICVGAGYGVESAPKAVSLAEKFDNLYATVGIHPHDASDDYLQIDKSLESISALAEHEKVVAIGETGLDFFRDWSPFDAQEYLFRKTIALAKNVNKPLVIHCRDAREDTLRILIQEDAHTVGGVFHCYSEDLDFSKRIADLGFIVSFTGVVTFRKAETLRELIKALPVDGFMLETDAPYMAPEPYRGKASEPAHVRIIAEKVASIKQISLQELATITTRTTKQIFQLPF